MGIIIERLTGTCIARELDQVAKLRIAVFADYPYLYDGSLDYERAYLSALAGADRAVLVVAREGQTVVGASTGLPLSGEHEAFKAPWREQGRNVDRIFYFAESVLLQEHRGRGIGHAFFDEREAHVRSFPGDYDIACFCSVERPNDHPLKPPDYRPLDAFWHSRGYRRAEGVKARFAWRDRGAREETDKPLQFWMKPL